MLAQNVKNVTFPHSSKGYNDCGYKTQCKIGIKLIRYQIHCTDAVHIKKSTILPGLIIFMKRDLVVLLLRRLPSVGGELFMMENPMTKNLLEKKWTGIC
jgi:hypothetical protein